MPELSLHLQDLRGDKAIVAEVAKEEGGRRTPVFEREHHASGHASREDLAEVIDQIDPDRIVPIHTESREQFADRFEDVVLAEEGVRIEF